jgi:predicted esterase
VLSDRDSGGGGHERNRCRNIVSGETTPTGAAQIKTRGLYWDVDGALAQKSNCLCKFNAGFTSGRPVSQDRAAHLFVDGGFDQQFEYRGRFIRRHASGLGGEFLSIGGAEGHDVVRFVPRVDDCLVACTLTRGAEDGRVMKRALSLGLLVFATHCVRDVPPAEQLGSLSSERGSEQNAAENQPGKSSTSGWTSVPFGQREGTTLEVPGLLPAPLFVPRGGEGSGPMRVAFFAHGAGGRGMDHCVFWDPHMPDDYVLVCPEGALLDRRNPHGGAYYPDHLKLREELVALVAALRERLGARIVQGGYRYVGYSQGATMGALAIVGEIDFFKELVLIEGGGENWSSRRATEFKARGGERVLLSCGTQGCTAHARRSVPILEAAGVEAQEAHAPGAGHTYGGGVGRAVLAKMADWN